MIALVATSSDPRYQETIDKWLKTNHLYGEHVRVSVAGSVKDRETLMKNIRFAKKYFEITKIFLINTQGDMAYADRNFTSDDMEQEANRNDLMNTKAAINAELPDLDVQTLFISSKHTVEKVV